jgi:hypothetical protein
MTGGVPRQRDSTQVSNTTSSSVAEPVIHLRRLNPQDCATQRFQPAAHA